MIENIISMLINEHIINLIMRDTIRKNKAQKRRDVGREGEMIRDIE